MGLGRRRIGVLVGSGVMAVGVAALVLAAVGVFAGTAGRAQRAPTRRADRHHDHGHRPPRRRPARRRPARWSPRPTAPSPGTRRRRRPRPTMTVPGSWYGYPSILPVITTEPGWLYVRLAQRPNGSTIWVRQSDVTLSSTPYAIVVNLTTMHLLVFDNGAQIFDFPAGIGAPDDPTPPGQYFMPMQYPLARPRVRSLRPRHVGPLRHHHGLGEHGRRRHRDPRPDHLVRRLADRDDGRRHFARVHPAPRRRPGAALDHPARHADRHRRADGHRTARRIEAASGRLRAGRLPDRRAARPRPTTPSRGLVRQPADTGAIGIRRAGSRPCPRWCSRRGLHRAGGKVVALDILADPDRLRTLDLTILDA